ncbi:hypothetical protein ROP_pKNR-00720 (plasmid) [Rhodococcus opacus B4]|uniref:Uncharacterized protein n=1 Tax=Rhodococcus opacus (strain B4) TaxID=632772 RepID=C1BEC4_RHOOB|nr:hypothetical protein ROP_pKNR-00720 [Rhodococcus opacus B4]
MNPRTNHSPIAEEHGAFVAHGVVRPITPVDERNPTTIAIAIAPSIIRKPAPGPRNFEDTVDRRQRIPDSAEADARAAPGRA